MRSNNIKQKAMSFNQILLDNLRSGTTQEFKIKSNQDYKQLLYSNINPNFNIKNQKMSHSLLSAEVKNQISSPGKVKNITLDLKPKINVKPNIQLNNSFKPKPLSTSSSAKQNHHREDHIKLQKIQNNGIKKKNSIMELFRENMKSFLVQNRTGINKQQNTLNQVKINNIKLPIIAKSIQRYIQKTNATNKIQPNNDMSDDIKFLKRKKQKLFRKSTQQRKKSERYDNNQIKYFEMLLVVEGNDESEKINQYRQKKRQNFKQKFNQIKQISDDVQEQQQPLKPCLKVQPNKIQSIIDNTSKVSSSKIQNKKQKKLSMLVRQKQITVYEHKIKTYRDFIFKINFAHNRFNPIILKDQFGLYSNQEKRFKAYVGRGNNSLLIKSLIKRRFWWSIEQQSSDCNFVWTQLKMNNYYDLEVKIIKNIKQKSELPEQKNNLEKQSKIKQSKKQIVNKKNKFKVVLPTGLNKIFTKQDVQIYKKYQICVTNDQKMEDYDNRIKLINKKLIPVEDNFKYRVHNHLENNFYLGNKKAMFYNLRQYYGLINKNVFEYLPLTFHIKKGTEDKQFKQFLKYHKKKQNEILNEKKNSNDNQSDNEQKRRRNIWIVKPGENSNRGNGITVIDQLSQLTAQIKKKQFHPNGSPKTYIVQQYIQYPLLYHKRKFDIRHYMLITTLYGKMRGYWYSEGYIRTSSYIFDFDDLGSQIHLTNDAIQKKSQDYGKYQQGNKVSYAQFQKYLDATYPTKNYSFYDTIYPKMRQVALDSIRASYLRLDPNKLQHNFQVFGLDFMIDQNFNVWLIQINTNPCLQISSGLLGRIIPTMVQHSFRLSLDILFPPLAQYPNTMKYLAPDNALETLKYELIFDEQNEQEELLRLYKNNMELDCGEISQQQQTYEDEGKQCQLQVL